MERRNEAFIDWINLLLAIALIVSPWVMGFAAGTAMSNAVVAGIIIGAIAIAALVSFAQWEEWANLLLGVWVLISPWVLGFDGNFNALWTHVAIGLAVAILAAIELYLVQRHHPPARTI
jgi:hypothetical protein